MSEPANRVSKKDFDALGEAMKTFQRVEVPVTHLQTPGLYCRQVEIKSGTKILSARHKTEHPFIVSQGKVLVITEDGNRQIIEAPHMGITIPGTRRALHALEDTIWTTFHPTEEKDIEKICEGLIEPETDSSLLQWQDSLPKIEEPCHS